MDAEKRKNIEALLVEAEARKKASTPVEPEKKVVKKKKVETPKETKTEPTPVVTEKPKRVAVKKAKAPEKAMELPKPSEQTPKKKGKVEKPTPVENLKRLKQKASSSIPITEPKKPERKIQSFSDFLAKAEQHQRSGSYRRGVKPSSPVYSEKPIDIQSKPSPIQKPEKVSVPVGHIEAPKRETVKDRIKAMLKQGFEKVKEKVGSAYQNLKSDYTRHQAQYNAKQKLKDIQELSSETPDTRKTFQVVLKHRDSGTKKIGYSTFHVKHDTPEGAEQAAIAHVVKTYPHLDVHQNAERVSELSGDQEPNVQKKSPVMLSEPKKEIAALPAPETYGTGKEKKYTVHVAHSGGVLPISVKARSRAHAMDLAEHHAMKKGYELVPRGEKEQSVLPRGVYAETDTNVEKPFSVIVAYKHKSSGKLGQAEVKVHHINARGAEESAIHDFSLRNPHLLVGKEAIKVR